LDEYVLLGSKCGRLLQTEEKIVGGADVGYYKYPWYAVLRTHNTQLVCAGSLIGPKTVLTVAHCYKPWFQSVADGYVSHYKRGMLNSTFKK
jgi:secreted trypsin-like serine protease